MALAPVRKTICVELFKIHDYFGFSFLVSMAKLANTQIME
jgi:hypothetical protein